MAENAYDTVRRIENFYTSRINHLLETGQDDRADELTEEFVSDVRAALANAEGRAA